MPKIVNKEIVSSHLRLGIRAIVDKKRQNTSKVEEEIASLINVAVRTLRSWKNPVDIPNSIDTNQFMGLVWLILSRSDVDLDWLSGLLSNTDMVIVQPLSKEWLRGALLMAKNNGVTPSQDDIENVVARLIETETENEIGSLTTASANNIERITIKPLTASNKTYKTVFSTSRILIVLGIFIIVVTLITINGQLPTSDSCMRPINPIKSEFLPDQGFTLYEASSISPVRSVGIHGLGLWIGPLPSEKGFDGVVFYNGQTQQWFQCIGFPLSKNQNVNDIKIKDTSLYIATDQAGIGSLTDGKWTSYTIDHGLPSNAIYNLYLSDENELWTATSEGVAKLVRQHWELVYSGKLGELASNHVYDFLVDSRGNSWFALINKGISQLTPNGSWHSYFVTDPNLQNVRGIVEDNEGGVWFATDGGGVLRFLDGKWNTFNNNGTNLASNRVFDIEKDRFGRIWIATDKGVFYTPDLGQTWITHSTLYALSIKFGCSGCFYGEDDMWIVLKDRGIAHCDIPPIRTIIRFDKIPGLVKQHPHDEYVFSVQVTVLSGSLDKSDGLFSIEPRGSKWAGMLIPVVGEVQQGQIYTFSNVDEPIEMPDAPGIYQVSWRLWQNDRYVTEPIFITFEVASK